MGRTVSEYVREESDFLREYEGPYDSIEPNTNTSVALPRVADQSGLASLWMCLKVSIESTVFCGVLVGLYATLLWWLELNVRLYCLKEWKIIPDRLHRRILISDVIIVIVIMFWPFSCIAPLCGWSTTGKLNLVYYCVIGGILDATNRLIAFVFYYYGNKLKSIVGLVIFAATSFAVSFRFARYLKASGVVDYHVVALALSLSLQFILGMMVAIPFNLVFLEVYYKSSSVERTILACVLIFLFAIPKLFVTHVITNIHGICKPGDEIMLAVAYITGTTLCSRSMQASIESLPYFIVISVLHGLLNVADKLSFPLKRKILSRMCLSYTQNGNRQSTSENASLLLANQTLISIITEATTVMYCSAAAYLSLYYYKGKRNLDKRYTTGSKLFQELMIRCSIGVGIELTFNVLALRIVTYLYNIPIIAVWKSKKKFIIIVHMIQVLFIVLYFSVPINDVLVRDYYAKANITCLGFFKRI